MSPCLLKVIALHYGFHVITGAAKHVHAFNLYEECKLGTFLLLSLRHTTFGLKSSRVKIDFSLTTGCDRTACWFKRNCVAVGLANKVLAYFCGCSALRSGATGCGGPHVAVSLASSAMSTVLEFHLLYIWEQILLSTMMECNDGRRVD